MSEGETSTQALGRISPQALRDATGRDWDDWLATLDAAGAAEWNHKGNRRLSRSRARRAWVGWWRHSIASPASGPAGSGCSVRLPASDSR